MFGYLHPKLYTPTNWEVKELPCQDSDYVYARFSLFQRKLRNYQKLVLLTGLFDPDAKRRYFRYP